jgi:hypothetical protein
LFTIVLLSTIVSPIASDCARLSRPPSVVESAFCDSVKGGAKKYVVAM